MAAVLKRGKINKEQGDILFLPGREITGDLPHPDFKIYKLGMGISLFVPLQFIWQLSKALVCTRGDAFCCFLEKFN